MELLVGQSLAIRHRRDSRHAAAGAADPPHRAAGRARSRRGARRGDRPPRPQAGQRDAGGARERRRLREGARLRHRQGRQLGGAGHARRAGVRDAALHVARAGGGQGGRRAHGHLCARRHALRDGQRRGAVRRRQLHGDPDPASVQGAAPAAIATAAAAGERARALDAIVRKCMAKKAPSGTSRWRRWARIWSGSRWAARRWRWRACVSWRLPRRAGASPRPATRWRRSRRSRRRLPGTTARPIRPGQADRSRAGRSPTVAAGARRAARRPIVAGAPRSRRADDASSRRRRRLRTRAHAEPSRIRAASAAAVGAVAVAEPPPPARSGDQLPASTRLPRPVPRAAVADPPPSVDAGKPHAADGASRRPRQAPPSRSATSRTRGAIPGSERSPGSRRSPASSARTSSRRSGRSRSPPSAGHGRIGSIDAAGSTSNDVASQPVAFSGPTSTVPLPAWTKSATSLPGRRRSMRTSWAKTERASRRRRRGSRTPRASPRRWWSPGAGRADRPCRRRWRRARRGGPRARRDRASRTAFPSR